MARTFTIIIILGLVTLALIPNPQNPARSEWDNIPQFEKQESPQMAQFLSTFGIHIPKELIPGLGLIGISIFLSIAKKLK